MKILNSVMGFILCLGTGMIGYHINVINNSSCPLFWAIMDFLFWPLPWIKWLIMQQVNLSIIRDTFGFILK